LKEESIENVKFTCEHGGRSKVVMMS